MYPLSTNRVIARGYAPFVKTCFSDGLGGFVGFCADGGCVLRPVRKQQRPLATVVIGGLIVSTVLTLLVIPVFYKIVGSAAVWKRAYSGKKFLLPAVVGSASHSDESAASGHIGAGH